MALAQPLGAILALWGAWLMLIGVRGWWTLGLLVTGGAVLGLPTLVQFFHDQAGAVLWIGSIALR
jgi:hypothetical protein